MKHSSLVVMMVVVWSVWRRHVNLLVHELKLLGLSLCNIQPNTQVVVVLDQLLDSSSAVSQIMRQHFSLAGKLLNNLGNFDSIECCLSKLFIFVK